VKGLCTVRAKGRTYCYAWRGGPLIWKGIGNPVIGAAEIEAIAKALANRGGDAGTFGRLKADWRASPEWANFAKATRNEWGKVIDTVPDTWDRLPLRFFNDPRARGFIADWRAEFAGTPRSADYRVQVLRALFAWARGRGELAANPADSVPKLYSGANRAHIIWEPAERATWQQAPQGIRDAFNLACLSGLRRRDLCEVPLSAIGRHAIVWHTSKSGRRTVVSVPLYPALGTLLDDLRSRYRKPGVETILVSAKGEARSPAGLTAHFDRTRADLSLPSKHLHDCRGTFATELMLVGMTDKEIADIMGWSPANVATIRRLYVDQARVMVSMGERMQNRAQNQ